MLLKFVTVLILLAQLQTSDLLEPYRERAKSWEPDVAALIAKNDEQVAGKEQILFLGSSSIRMWDSIDEDLPDRDAVRRGYGGARFSDLAVYIDRLIEGHDPQAIVIFVANDISGDTGRDIAPEEVARLAEYCLTQIRSKFEQTPVLFVAITPTPKRFEHWSKISSANELIKKMALEQESCFFLETAEHFLNEEGKPKGDFFRDDNLHLNDSGYDLWGQLIEAALKHIVDQPVKE